MTSWRLHKGSSARDLAEQQAARRRTRRQWAEARRLLAEGQVVPARISIAMNIRELEGAWVDEACGAAEPDVDDWEAGLKTPTPRQVVLMARLTGFPIPWFYKPIAPGPMLQGPIWMCYSRKVDGARCHLVQPDWVDERGVLHYGEEDETRPPSPAQVALPLFTEDEPLPEPFFKPVRSPRRDGARAHLRAQRRQPVTQPTLPGALAADERAELMARIAAAKKAVRRPTR